MIYLLKEGRFLSERLFFGEFRDDPKPGMVRIAAKPEEGVQVFLRKRKGEGFTLITLRLFNMMDLFRFTGEQAELFPFFRI